MPHTIHYATNKRTFLDISHPSERALALINFVAATKTEELITSFSMHSRESFSLAFPELGPYISSRLSSYIEIRESIPTHIYTLTRTHTHRRMDITLLEHETAPEAYLGGKLMKCKVFHVDYQLLLARCDMSSLIRGVTIYRFHSNALTLN